MNKKILYRPFSCAVGECAVEPLLGLAPFGAPLLISPELREIGNNLDILPS